MDCSSGEASRKEQSVAQKKKNLDPSGQKKGQNFLHKSSFGVPKAA